MTAEFKFAVILERNASNCVTGKIVDTSPITTDSPDVDSLDLANWVIEKFANDMQLVDDVAFFENLSDAKDCVNRFAIN